MKILITGSSGFIGLNLIKFLKQKGIETVSYDIRENPLDDVRDFQRLRNKMESVDGVVHLAAVSRVKIAYQNPLQCIDVNVGGTTNVLEAAREMGNRPWVIFGSSREVFGEPKDLPVTEESPRSLINVYGVAKIAGEDLCKMFSKNYNLKTRVLRFSNSYTDKNDQLDRVVPKFILQASRNEDLVINGTGEEMVFDFTYIDDTINGIWGCIQDTQKRDVNFDDFILSNGQPNSLKRLAEIAIKETNSKSEIKYAESRSYDVERFYADPKKAKEILGFSPSTSLEEGIKLSISKLGLD
ncbi:MAG: NAD-dependent epimerase/dehydratase family protein [Candidatus Nealsonbacteria bacterium]|nr:NAD-dependent epimerase/dehydratase family protein [Candidatus Nealsonbacteria bacterium]